MAFCKCQSHFTKLVIKVSTSNNNSPMVSRNAWWPQFNMAAAAISNFEKLRPFFHFLPTSSQYGLHLATPNKQHFYDTEKRLVIKTKNCGIRHLNFRNSDATYSSFDKLYLAGMLRLRITTHLWNRKTSYIRNSTWWLPPS